MSMQGPSNLSNACISMTVMEQRWKQDCLSKRIPNINLVFELRTQTFSSTHLGLRLQQKPQKQKSCFWFPSVLLLGETRLMKYKLDLKDKHRSQIHTTVVLKDDLKATCDKYRPYTEKIRESAMRKQQRFSNFHLELHSSPCSWLLEFDCQLPNSCWVLNGCSLKHSPWHKQRTEKDDYKHRPPAYLNIWPPQQHRQRLLWVCW